ncbi:Uncharacterised protein [Metamycoplasma arthritidis]|uniref:Conserved hypothetical membrane protein n=1 Tax=Metamycoplasma arthritidis (strain 158L3-1) TaxID=243272 RepID=B3PLX5_META1|nr:hypothetical protein [Metamycoplasma arthritidis]ACF07027.1 conserved hypothetical membrane protein [Metamycoplasma arthritidis 158L3-1]VEU78555.1 Uncharacterised protein [Metamycoplasma arthritidis]
MFFNTSTFNNNVELTILVNLLIYIAILLGIPMLFLSFLSLFKLHPTNKKTIYLYAFSTGMFLMIGAAGFIKEGWVLLEQWFHKKDGGLLLTKGIVALEQSFIAMIVGYSAMIGLAIVIIGRYVFIRTAKVDFHKKHSDHGHSEHITSFRDIDNPKAAWSAILMLLSHRIIDGLVLGITIYQVTINGVNKANIPLIVTFNIHILLEIIIVYYRQMQYGEKRTKAILFNFITLLLIIPIMFFGAFLGKFLDRIGWLIPSLEIMGGTIVIFMSIIELVPEFIHYRNEKVKTIYGTLATIALAMVFTLVLLSFHTHTSPPKIEFG